MHTSRRFSSLNKCLLGITSTLAVISIAACGDPSLQSQEPALEAKPAETVQTRTQSSGDASSPSTQQGLRHSSNDEGHVVKAARLSGDDSASDTKDIAECEDSDYASAKGKGSETCSQK